MSGIDVGSLVILHCANPREKVWGVLVRLDQVGIVIRGLDLNSVEEWLQQEAANGEQLIAPSTQFVPIRRVERIYLDESTPVLSSYGSRYASACGGDARQVLLEGRPPDIQPGEPEGPVS